MFVLLLKFLSNFRDYLRMERMWACGRHLLGSDLHSFRLRISFIVVLLLSAGFGNIQCSSWGKQWSLSRLPSPKRDSCRNLG